jgi:hypothetical protein
VATLCFISRVFTLRAFFAARQLATLLGNFFKRVKPTLFSFRVLFVCSHVFPAFYFLCIYFLFISLLLIYFWTCIYLYINCGFWLLYEWNSAPEFEKKSKFKWGVSSMGPGDVHPTRWYTKTPPRVDLFKSFISNGLAPPLDKILNLVDNSGNLV